MKWTGWIGESQRFHIYFRRSQRPVLPKTLIILPSSIWPQELSLLCILNNHPWKNANRWHHSIDVYSNNLTYCKSPPVATLNAFHPYRACLTIRVVVRVVVTYAEMLCYFEWQPMHPNSPFKVELWALKHVLWHFIKMHLALTVFSLFPCKILTFDPTSEVCLMQLFLRRWQQCCTAPEFKAALPHSIRPLNMPFLSRLWRDAAQCVLYITWQDSNT